jgi:RND family efflux transporter MFP subunit
MSGRAGAVAVVRGSLVQPGGAAMVTISQMDPVGVSFTLPEGQLPALRRADQDGGVALAVQLPGERRGQPAATLDGRVSFIDSAIDPASGTIRVKGSVPNADRQLWPGQYVTVKLVLRTLPGALLVPQAALIQRGPERSVYVVDAEGRAQMKPVQTRAPQGELIVVEGLSAGEKVVVEGKQNLRPGTPVREVAAPAGKGASAAAEGASSAAASGASR